MISARMLRIYRSLFIYLSIITVCAAILLGAMSSSATDNAFSLGQKEQLNKLIKKYIYEHPEVIVDAIHQMQKREKAKEDARVISAIKENKQELEEDKDTPIIGNPYAAITVIEFFDYRCGYCKRVFSNMIKILQETSNVRFVLKELPILGPDSVAASRASLAVWRTHKEKYQAFHSALLKTRGGIPEAKILSIASNLGINTNQLKKDIVAPEIDDILAKNQRLAQALNINGTPAFVIGNKLVPGALDLATLRRLIASEGG